MKETMKHLRSIKWWPGIFMLAAMLLWLPSAGYAQGNCTIDPLVPPNPLPQCRFISGRVTNPAGVGVDGVVINISVFGGVIDTVVTGGGGFYGSSQLLRFEVYEVKPQTNNNGYRFNPVSRTVVLINNTSNINFTKIFRDQRADFDGDGKTDISVFNRGSGLWTTRNSSNGQDVTLSFGQAADIITPGDFNGDGKTDRAIFRPGDGNWWIATDANISPTHYVVHFGMTADVPVPRDYDGDGKTDLAVMTHGTQNTWSILNSSNNTETTVGFGVSADIPVPGDYDGDGKAEIAVFRPSDATWYIRRPDGTYYGVPFGITGDLPVEADYDGDGKTDIAVVRTGPSDFHILGSQSGYQFVHWGITGDTPVPGDYDGDGKADIAVRRLTPGDQGTWYVLQSTGGYTATTFVTDFPVPRGHLFPAYN